eukprot:scaffold46671_cov88-Skeletonema_marinoi.AAC.1
MESEMRKSSMKQDDVRSKSSNGFFGSTKSNGFSDMPSPPFHLSENDLSPNDVRSNSNNIGGYNTRLLQEDRALQTIKMMINTAGEMKLSDHQNRVINHSLLDVSPVQQT